MTKQKKLKTQISKNGPLTDAKGIMFRQFYLSAYCAHGDRIGRTWKVVLDKNEPEAAPLSAVERILGLLYEWVSSDSYSEPDSTKDIVGALACNYGSGEGHQDITAEDVDIIEDIMEEFDHALQLIDRDLWEAGQRAMAVEFGLRPFAPGK